MKLQEENSVFALGISWPVLNKHTNESIIKESWVNPECTCAQNAYHKQIQEVRKCMNTYTAKMYLFSLKEGIYVTHIQH